MVFNTSGLIRTYDFTLTKRRITWSRMVRALQRLIIFPPFWLMFSLGRCLDNVFSRGYRSQEIKAPVYIMGNPRSGTTFLHRLMCLDESHFTYFKTYQLVFPSVTLYRLFAALSQLDGLFGERLSRWVTRSEARFFAPWREIHPMGFTLAEEDEGLFAHTFFTPLIYLFFPFTELLEGVKFCDRLPPKTRRQLAAYYKGCVQRHMYAAGRNRVLLSKNTFLPGRIDSILEAFPDAKFVDVVRHPYDAIPSLMSLFHAIWSLYSPEIAKASPESYAVAQMGFEYYRLVLEHRTKFPEGAFVTVRYEDLVTDPKRVVEQLYRWLNLPMSAAFAARLADAGASHNRYHSTHRYSLEEYGLTKQHVYNELKDVFDAYGFAR